MRKNTLFKPYVVHDLNETWKSLRSNLPALLILFLVLFVVRN